MGRVGFGPSCPAWDELSFIKLKLGRVGMGRVLHLGPSWHGPSWFWAELSCTRSKLPHVYLGYDTNDVDRL